MGKRGKCQILLIFFACRCRSFIENLISLGIFALAREGAASSFSESSSSPMFFYSMTHIGNMSLQCCINRRTISLVGGRGIFWEEGERNVLAFWENGTEESAPHSDSLGNDRNTGIPTLRLVCLSSVQT